MCHPLSGVDYEPVPEIDVGPVSGADVGPMSGHDVECDLRKDPYVDLRTDTKDRLFYASTRHCHGECRPRWFFCFFSETRPTSESRGIRSQQR